MKLKHVLVTIAVCLISIYGIQAQSKSPVGKKTVTIQDRQVLSPNTKIKKTYTAKGVRETASTTTVRPIENMCKPINIASTIRILQQSIGERLRIKLDKEGSYISVFDARMPIEFESYKVEKPMNDWTYYIQDINSFRTSVNFENGNYNVKVEFESEKSEIKGICHGCTNWPVSRDERAPDLNWTNPSLLITMKPEIFENSVSLQPIEVKLMGELNYNGTFHNFFPIVTRHFQSKIAVELKKQLVTAFSQPEVKRLIASALKSEIDALGIGPVKRTDLSGTQLYLCNY